MGEKIIRIGKLGWIPDVPSFRDYTVENTELNDLISPAGLRKVDVTSLSSSADLRQWWCNKCQGLFFAENPSPGVCPAGGAHDGRVSGKYSIVQK